MKTKQKKTKWNCVHLASPKRKRKKRFTGPIKGNKTILSPHLELQIRTFITTWLKFFPHKWGYIKQQSYVASVEPAGVCFAQWVVDWSSAGWMYQHKNTRGRECLYVLFLFFFLFFLETHGALKGRSCFFLLKKAQKQDWNLSPKVREQWKN